MLRETNELQRAFQLHQQGRLAEAAVLYESVAARNPKNYDALHFLGVVKAAFGQREDAKRLMARSLSARPVNVAFVENYVNLLAQLGEYDEAAKLCAKTIRSTKRTETLTYVLGFCAYRKRRFEDAVAEFKKLLALNPKHLAATNEIAVALAELKRYDEAHSYLDKALALDPNSAPSLLNKGNILLLSGRLHEAIPLYKRAIASDPRSHDAHLGLGYAYQNLRQYEAAFAAFDAALALKPDLDGAFVGRGNVLLALRRHDEAAAAYERALALNPKTAEAWIGIGNVLLDRQQFEESLLAYDKAVALEGELATAWNGRANALSSLNRYEDAFVAFDKVFRLQPELEGAEGQRLHMKMRICNWDNLDAERTSLIESVRRDRLHTPPLLFLSVSASPADQFRCARAWTAKRHSATSGWQGESRRQEKIRIAYVSGDFRQHPVAWLTAGMFENHDKSKFDVTAISFGSKDSSDMRGRLEAAFDRFIDVGVLSPELVAERIRQERIDILVDLAGHTQLGGLAVFARRPAPVQVAYLGYPGTTGADFVDYLIADQTIIPESDRQFYTEKIVYLPDTFQANDVTRTISDAAQTRAQFGLPDTGFVFCCFNNNYKILPEVFDCWMRVLRRVAGSVLWLPEDNPVAARNLRKEAVARGIDAGRLVFSQRLPTLAEHLARHRLADLFLDTLPYNAHTTASDALWAGLPVLTQTGETYAGRVATSVLNAIGLPELVARTPEEYEAMAVDLATNHEKLAAIRAKLAHNRLAKPLFDTGAFTRHIERAYATMLERHLSGLPPEHIDLRRRN